MLRKRRFHRDIPSKLIQNDNRSTHFFCQCLHLCCFLLQSPIFKNLSCVYVWYLFSDWLGHLHSCPHSNPRTHSSWKGLFTGVNQTTFLTCSATCPLLSVLRCEHCGLVLRFWNESAPIHILVLSLTCDFWASSADSLDASVFYLSNRDTKRNSGLGVTVRVS